MIIRAKLIAETKRGDTFGAEWPAISFEIWVQFYGRLSYVLIQLSLPELDQRTNHIYLYIVQALT